MDKVGRNDPCPCGSGKKYKKCCMAKDRESNMPTDAKAGSATVSSDHHNRRSLPPRRAAEVENIFGRGRNYMEKGEFDRAARAFRSVLNLDPGHYEALTGLGRCLAEAGMREEARKCFEKALEIKPDYTQARVNLEMQKM